MKEKQITPDPLFPYIGISDVTYYPNILDLYDTMNRWRRNSPYLLLIEVPVNGIDLHQETIRDYFRHVFQFQKDNGILNCIRYGSHSPEQDLAETLARIAYCGGSDLRAIRLDIDWPDPSAIRAGDICVMPPMPKEKDAPPPEAVTPARPEIILTVTPKTLGSVQYRPKDLVSRLRDYLGVVDRVVLDATHADGPVRSVEDMLPFAEEMTKRLPAMSIGVAGNLGPKNLTLLQPFLKACPGMSFEATYTSESLAEQFLIRALDLTQ